MYFSIFGYLWLSLCNYSQSAIYIYIYIYYSIIVNFKILYIHTNIESLLHAFFLFFWIYTSLHKELFQRMRQFYLHQNKNKLNQIIQYPMVRFYLNLNQKSTFQPHLLHDSYYQVNPSVPLM